MIDLIINSMSKAIMIAGDLQMLEGVILVIYNTMILVASVHISSIDFIRKMPKRVT
jgi:hypothetical protein